MASSSRPRRILLAPLVLTLALVGCSSAGASPSASTAATTAPAASAAPTTAPAASPSAAAATTAPTPAKVGLMLSYIPSVQFFPPLLAKGLGYFEDEGLTVDVQPSEGSSFVIQQVAAGNIESGLPATQSVLLGFAQAPDFKVVYQFATRSFGLYVLADSPIKTVADLKGKTIGTTDLGGGETLSLRIDLERAGLNAGSDAKIEVLGYNELGMAEALQNKRVDAVSIYWSTSAIADHAGIPLRCITCETGTPQVGMALVASNKLLESDSSVVARLGRALAKATLFAQTNPEAALKVLQKVNPEGSTDIDQLRDSLKVATDAIAPAAGTQYGQNDRAAWEALQQGLLAPGSQSGLSAPVDLSALIDDSLVAQFNDFDHDAVIKEATDYAP